MIAALQGLYDELGNGRVTDTISAHPLDTTMYDAVRPRRRWQPYLQLSHQGDWLPGLWERNMLESEDNGDPFANGRMEFAG